MDRLKLKEQSETLLGIHREIEGFYDRHAKSAGLTLAGLRVLLIIFDEENCTQSTIVKKAFLPKQTVNAIIKKLYENNIIELSVNEKSDKRNKVIKFTKEGKSFIKNIAEKVKDIEYKALDAIGAEKRENLIEIITLYKNNLKIN